MKRNPYKSEKLMQAYQRLTRRPMTIDDIAVKMGVTSVYVYKILSGEKFYAPAVEKVAGILGVPMEELRK